MLQFRKSSIYFMFILLIVNCVESTSTSSSEEYMEIETIITSGRRDILEPQNKIPTQKVKPQSSTLSPITSSEDNMSRLPNNITGDELKALLEEINKKPAASPDISQISPQTFKEFSHFFRDEENTKTSIAPRQDTDNATVHHLCIELVVYKEYTESFNANTKSRVQIVQKDGSRQRFRTVNCGDEDEIGDDAKPPCHQQHAVTVKDYKPKCSQGIIDRPAVVWANGTHWEAVYIPVPSYCECILTKP